MPLRITLAYFNMKLIAAVKGFRANEQGWQKYIPYGTKLEHLSLSVTFTQARLDTYLNVAPYVDQL